VSDYCKAQFFNEWNHLLAYQAKIQVKEMTFTMLLQMIDFAYINIVNWSQIHDFENNNEIAKKLNKLLNLLQIINMWLLKILHTMIESKIIDNVIIDVRSDNVEFELIWNIAKNVNAWSLTSHCNAFIANSLNFMKTARSQD